MVSTRRCTAFSRRASSRAIVVLPVPGRPERMMSIDPLCRYGRAAFDPKQTLPENQPTGDAEQHPDQRRQRERGPTFAAEQDLRRAGIGTGRAGAVGSIISI